MLHLASSDYVLVTDLAAKQSHLRFTDWREVGSVELIGEGDCLCFRLTEALPAGQFLIVGERKAVKALARAIDRQTYS